MPKIDRHIVDRIMEVARIEEVVGDFVDLKRSGVRYLGLCPFHDDRHLGSFVVYPKGNCYKCFKCEARGGAVDFVMSHCHLSFPDAIRWLGRKYSIDTDSATFDYTPPPPRPRPQPKPLLVLPFKMVTDRERGRELDQLCRWISEGISWDAKQRGEIQYVLSAYHVGHSRIAQQQRDGTIRVHEFTVFWQIDEQQRVRTGHMMKYGADGHRLKKPAERYETDWVHSLLCRRRNDQEPYPYPDYYNPDREEHQTTLFGLHLLDRYGTDATVCIVESEKTALLMAIAYSNNRMQVWMACAGIANLTRERLKPIIDRRRRITLYPDRDGIDRWRRQAELLHYDLVTVDTTPVTKWWKPEDGEKADIADVVVRMINERNKQ